MNPGPETLGTATGFVCKLCRSTALGGSYLLERPWKSTGRYLVVICGGCGLLQNLYDWQLGVGVQKSEKLNILDPTEHPQWDSEAELEANTDKAQAFARALDARGLVRGQRILEVGSSKGLFLRACLDLGAASVTGQEFFRQGPIDYARHELGIADVRSVGFEDADAWPDGEFDLVCSFDVAEHTHDLLGFFSQCIRVTKPGGVQYHATPGSDSISNRLGRVLVGHFGVVSRLRTFGTSMCNLQHDENFRGGAHVALLGIAQVRWLASHFGLTLIDAHYTSSYTYSNRHYAALIPGLRQLPAPIGSSLFGVVRRVIRNKLVFTARVERPSDSAPVRHS